MPAVIAGALLPITWVGAVLASSGYLELRMFDGGNGS